MNNYDLQAQYDCRNQFYSNARVQVEENGDLTLWSYNTNVATIKEGVVKVTNTQSQTTVRHVKEFLKQNGFKADTTKQIEEDY